MQIKKIAVMGAGLMGNGIAQVFAQTIRCDVYLYDIKPELVEYGFKLIKNKLTKNLKQGKLTQTEVYNILSNIHVVTNLNEALLDADLVVEAITEDVRLKQNLLSEIELVTKPSAYIASNTSSIRISELASIMTRPERFAGLHFFNPPQTMPLVEIIPGNKTSPETVSFLAEIAKKIGKEAIVLSKDAPGFVVNRILMLALNEAVSLVEDGVASVEDIDKAIKLGLNWPMGPLLLIDYIGVDTVIAICNVLEKDFGPKYSPNRLLIDMKNNSLLGKKSGNGFYDWTKES